MNRCLAAFLAASSIALLVASGCSSPLGGSTCPEGKGTGTCFQVQSPGPMQTCSYNSGNAASCSAGQSSGHCPSAKPRRLLRHDGVGTRVHRDGSGLLLRGDVRGPGQERLHGRHGRNDVELADHASVS